MTMTMPEKANTTSVLPVTNATGAQNSIEITPKALEKVRSAMAKENISPESGSNFG